MGKSSAFRKENYRKGVGGIKITIHLSPICIFPWIYDTFITPSKNEKYIRASTY
jgi:hypothetical protein